MNASPNITADCTMFARQVLDVAAQVEAAENNIKDALMAAARAGDTARVIEILTRWKSLPACEVLSRGTP
jgi:hypothetical protein